MPPNYDKHCTKSYQNVVWIVFYVCIDCLLCVSIDCLFMCYPFCHSYLYFNILAYILLAPYMLPLIEIALNSYSILISNMTWRISDITPLNMRRVFFSLCAVKLLLRPRWKEHRVSPAVSFHILRDSSLMLLSEINRAFNSHSSGSCASNYATYTLKHSK